MHTDYTRHGPVINLLFADRPVYRSGEPVELALIKANLSPAPVFFTYPTSQRFDFAVYRDGQEIWRWSFDKVFIQVIETVTLNPFETVTYRVTWPQVNNQGRQVPPGIYTIRAWNPFIGFEVLPWPEIQVRIS
ncbi:hypothetical protein FDZ73_19825 [bacterium]|nr:MAG: hypothetical protein FDZ73_19825 [bacterium]